MALSVALPGTDLIGQARTGTGKTLAFGIPVCSARDTEGPASADMPRASRRPRRRADPRAGVQVSGDLAIAGKRLGLRVLTVYGGVGYEPSSTRSSGVDIVVGTPGRLIDLATAAPSTCATSPLVLDEADRMLDLGFLPDVEKSSPRPPRRVRRCCSRRPCPPRSSRWPVATCGTR